MKYYQDSVDGTQNGNVIPFSGGNQITSSQNSFTAPPDTSFGSTTAATETADEVQVVVSGTAGAGGVVAL